MEFVHEFFEVWKVFLGTLVGMADPKGLGALAGILSVGMAFFVGLTAISKVLRYIGNRKRRAQIQPGDKP